MKDHRIIYLIVLCLWIAVYYALGCTIDLFGTTCGCSTVNIREGPSGKKLHCHRIDVKHFLQTAQFPDDVIWIDFSENHEEQLSELTFGTNELVLKHLLNVYRLDFSKNRIWKISPNTFMPVRNLTQLNLSHNNIGNLTQGMFNGLSRLKVLDLSSNKFPIVPGYAFTTLSSLQKVDVRSTDLVCNCLMKDFIRWLKSRGTDVKVLGTCHLPKHGMKLRRLDPAKMSCTVNNAALPHFEIAPSNPQLIVQGDTIDMQCEGTNLPNSTLFWSLNETRLQSESGALSFNTSVNHYKSIITGWLTVKNVTTAHTGLWNCVVVSRYGRNSKSTRWIVIKTDAQYCKKDRVVNNHGEFSWPSTLEGLSRNVQCGSKGLFATRPCRHEGWANGNYIDCPFDNFVTNEIHSTGTFMANSLSKNRANLLMSLLTTLGGKPIAEILAFNFMNEILNELVQSLTPNANDKDSIGRALLNLGSYVMKTNVSLLSEAEFNYGICKRIIELIKYYNIKSRRVSAIIEEESENIAIRAVRLDDKSQLASAMACTISENKIKLHVFCHTVATPGPQSSILLPQTVLDTCSKSNGPYKIYFIAYRNAKVFPQTSLSTGIQGNVTIPEDIGLLSEMVFQVDIYGCTPKNLSDPIVFNFLTKDKGSHYPAVWTSDGWKKDAACSAACMNKNFTQVKCYKFATITLIYDHDSNADGSKNWSLTSSTHPAILAATIILIVCLIVVMVHYRFYAERLCVDNEARHMVVSICFHMVVAACLFAFCVRLGRNRTICVICGLVLHYSSLAVLFWITLSVRNILRQLVSLTKPPALEPRPPKPMLRFYLIGCGIPLIICGITAAAKLENYGGEKKYCWLAWETSIYAFYLPAAFVAVVCIFYLLRVLCTFNHQSFHLGANRSPVIGHSWPRSERTRNANNRYQAISASEPCHCSEYLNQSRADNPTHRHHVSCPFRPSEQSFKSQVVGTAVLFVLYLFTWVAAALSISVPDIEPTFSVDGLCMKKNEEDLHQQISYDAFSWLYAVLAVSIGVFAVMRSLLLRNACRSRFMKCFDRSDSRNNDTGSLSSVSKQERLDDANLDHLTSSNDKSFPTGNRKHRAYPTIKTDPTSETMLESTDIVENFVADSIPPYQDSCRKSHWNNGLAENCEPCIIHGNNRISNSASSLQKTFTRGQYSQNDSRSHAMDSTLHAKFSHHNHPHDICRMNPRGHHAEALPYHHIGYHNHHVSHHHDHGKAMKMTNLHMAHDSSITEHSLDDTAFNNMHTVPVIMQNHMQAKVNNSAMVDRYQKMRRALEKKRARQRKLNVLREYAQDPLTSNDEGRNQVESNSDYKRPNESIPFVGEISRYGTTQQSENQSFRPLLILPAHKRSEKNDKNRGSGPNKRLKRLQLGSHPARSENRSKRRKSRDSISSEREQDTISSKNYEDNITAIAENSTLLIHPLEGDSLTAVSQSSATKALGAHGYLTLQQFQTAGGFLFPSRNNQVLEDLPTTHELTLPAAVDQGHVNTTESSRIEPQTNETTL